MVVLLKVFFIIKVMSSTGCYGYNLDSGGHVTALLLGNKGESTSSVPLSVQHKYIQTSNMTLTMLQESINLAAIQRTSL